MKITTWNCFKLALAITAGYEFGRILPGAAIQITHMFLKGDVKREYKRRMKAAEARGDTVNLADYAK